MRTQRTQFLQRKKTLYLLQLSLCPKCNTDLASVESVPVHVIAAGQTRHWERSFLGKKKEKKNKALTGHVAGLNQHAAFLKLVSN